MCAGRWAQFLLGERLKGGWRLGAEGKRLLLCIVKKGEEGSKYCLYPLRNG